MTQRHETADEAAKAWAKRRQLVHGGGGWLYLPGSRVALCQGYNQLVPILRGHDAIRQDGDGMWWISNQDVEIK